MSKIQNRELEISAKSGTKHHTREQRSRDRNKSHASIPVKANSVEDTRLGRLRDSVARNQAAVDLGGLKDSDESIAKPEYLG